MCCSNWVCRLRLYSARPRPNHCQMVDRVLASGDIYEACGRLEGGSGGAVGGHPPSEPVLCCLRTCEVEYRGRISGFVEAPPMVKCCVWLLVRIEVPSYFDRERRKKALDCDRTLMLVDRSSRRYMCFTSSASFVFVNMYLFWIWSTFQTKSKLRLQCRPTFSPSATVKACREKYSPNFSWNFRIILFGLRKILSSNFKIDAAKKSC